MDTHVLNEKYTQLCDRDNVEAFHSRMILVCCNDKDNDDVWKHTCPYLYKSAHCKHIVRFDKNMLGIPVNEIHDIPVLTIRAKRGRLKNTPEALEVMEHDEIV